MTFSLPYLLLGLAFLWFPRQWLRFGSVFWRRRRRKVETEPWATREPGDMRVKFKVEFTKFRNFVDLLRAGVGGTFILGGLGVVSAVLPDANASKIVTMQVIAIRATILLIGLLIQTLRFKNGRVAFFPPIFYLAGLSVGLCDPRGAAFAFALIWSINSALPNAQAFLTIYALLLVTFGHFIAWAGDLSAAYAGVLCFLPVLLSLLLKRPLIVFTRKSQG